MVAVNASHSLSEALAIAVMRRYRAHDIERVMGTWREGVWEDFDRASTPQLLPQSPYRNLAANSRTARPQ